MAISLVVLGFIFILVSWSKVIVAAYGIWLACVGVALIGLARIVQSYNQHKEMLEVLRARLPGKSSIQNDRDAA